MKTTKFKALLILLGLMLFTSGNVSANVFNDFKHFIGTEFSGMEALYLMGGIIVGSLVLYLMVNHFGKEAELKQQASGFNSGYHRRHRNHRIVKKTS